MNMKAILPVIGSIIAVIILSLIAFMSMPHAWFLQTVAVAWSLTTILGIILSTYVTKRIDNRWKKITSVVLLVVFLPILILLEAVPRVALSIYWCKKGHALSDMGRHSEAIEYYDKAMRIDPKSAVIWNNKGKARSDMGRHSEAIE